MCHEIRQGLFLIHHQKPAFSYLLYLFIWYIQIKVVPLPTHNTNYSRLYRQNRRK